MALLENEKRIIQQSIQEEAKDAVRFLAQYFGLSEEVAVGLAKEKNLQVQMREGTALAGGRPCYYSTIEGCHILLPFEPKDDRDSFTIGHELGHWFHEMINSGNTKSGNCRLEVLCEGIAHYTGIIWIHKGDPLQNNHNEYSLERLSRLKWHEVDREFRGLKKFLKETLTPYNPQEDSRKYYLRLIDECH